MVSSPPAVLYLQPIPEQFGSAVSRIMMFLYSVSAFFDHVGGHGEIEQVMAVLIDDRNQRPGSRLLSAAPAYQISSISARRIPELYNFCLIQSCYSVHLVQMNPQKNLGFLHPFAPSELEQSWRGKVKMVQVTQRNHCHPRVDSSDEIIRRGGSAAVMRHFENGRSQVGCRRQ